MTIPGHSTARGQWPASDLSHIAESEALLLADAQTSGGLLVALPKSEAPRAIDALREVKTPVAVAIGHVVERQRGGWVMLQ